LSRDSLISLLLDQYPKIKINYPRDTVSYITVVLPSWAVSEWQISGSKESESVKAHFGTDYHILSTIM
jgi:hypothetical protein